jgi:hypothetical protein
MTLARFCAALAIATIPGPAGAAEPVPLPGWMTGCHTETKGERWAEECWTVPRAGIMLGSGRSGKGETLQSWEAMRIERGADGTLTFWGSPSGAKPVAFRMERATANEIVFANPAHDYPQRIRYWRDGKVLNAEVSLSDGSKAMRWVYQ